MGGKPRQKSVLIKPRPHQKAAIKAVVRELVLAKRAQLIMACGSGKTHIGAWVAQKLGANRIVILVPSLALITQSRDVYRDVLKKDVKILIVCGDTTVRQHDESFDVTTDPMQARKFMRKRGKRVVFCTYQSAHVLEGLSFDYGVFDESHKTTGTKDKVFASSLYDEGIHIKRRLFMTATPRRTVSKGMGVDIVTMDDERVYGRVAYSLSFRKAVEAGIICDYRILITILHENADTEKNSAAQVALARAVRKYGIKSIFSYHHTISEAQAFLYNMEKILPKATLLHVNGKQSWVERSEYMKTLEDSELALMTNARCLVEGVDVPSVDMTAFTKPKRSVVDIVQATGRAMRKDPKNPAKKFGYVLVPVFLKDGHDLETALKETKFDHLFDVISAMRDQDEVLAAAIATGLSGGSYAKLPNVIYENLTDYKIDNLEAAIGVRVVEGITPSIERKKAQLLALAKRGAPRPNSNSRDPEERKLGLALGRYTSPSRKSYDPKLHARLKSESPGWFPTDPERKKAQLLALAKRGAPRPRFRDHSERKLGQALSSYTLPSSGMYDPKLHARLKSESPGWFPTDPDGKK